MEFGVFYLTINNVSRHFTLQLTASNVCFMFIKWIGIHCITMGSRSFVHVYDTLRSAYAENSAIVLVTSGFSHECKVICSKAQYSTISRSVICLYLQRLINAATLWWLPIRFLQQGRIKVEGLISFCFTIWMHSTFIWYFISLDFDLCPRSLKKTTPVCSIMKSVLRICRLPPLYSRTIKYGISGKIVCINNTHIHIHTHSVYFMLCDV